MAARRKAEISWRLWRQWLSAISGISENLLGGLAAQRPSAAGLGVAGGQRGGCIVASAAIGAAVAGVAKRLAKLSNI